MSRFAASSTRTLVADPRALVEALPDGCFRYRRPAGAAVFGVGRCSVRGNQVALDEAAQALRGELAARAGIEADAVRVVRLSRISMADGLLRMLLLTSVPGDAVLIACSTDAAAQTVRSMLSAWAIGRAAA